MLHETGVNRKENRYSNSIERYVSQIVGSCRQTYLHATIATAGLDFDM